MHGAQCRMPHSAFCACAVSLSKVTVSVCVVCGRCNLQQCGRRLVAAAFECVGSVRAAQRRI
eukprot:scaffold2015_cov92-Isochrysis_galbana.AAC.6